MTHHAVKFDYPHEKIPLILRSSIKEDTFYGLNIVEIKKLKLVLAKYGCRHTFHTLPDKVTGKLHPFIWDVATQSFRIQMKEKETVQLNTLEEAVVNHPLFEEV